MSGSPAAVLHQQFETLEQQRDTASLGMWAFLVQEVMFFGGLFAAYVVFSGLDPEAFVEGSAHLSIGWGTFNTVVLIGSSLTMALGVRSAQLGRGREVALWILATLALAMVFLGVKTLEYSDKFEAGLFPGLNWAPGPGSDPNLGVFYGMYFTMTGMHALHMVIGLGIMVVVASKALRGRYGPDNHIGVELLGLYWHFVDIVWIFLFPLLYLVGRHLPH